MRRFDIVFLLLACIAWGANIPLTSALLHNFDAWWLSVLRATLATVVLALLLVALEGARALRMRLPGWRFVGLSGVLGAFFVLYNLGLALTHPVTAAALQAGSPVYAALVLKGLTRAPLGRGFWGAAALTVIGAGIAVFGRIASTGHGIELTGGEPVVVASLMCWTLYSHLAQRWFGSDASQLQRTYASMAGGIVWLAAAWALMHAAGVVGAPYLHPEPHEIAYLLIAVVCATAGGTVLWNVGVNRTGLAVASLWQNTVPVFGVLFAIGLGMYPTPYQLVGGIVVLAGVLYMQWQRLRPEASGERNLRGRESRSTAP